MIEESNLIDLPPEVCAILAANPERMDEILAAYHEFYHECDATYMTPQ